MTYNPNKPEEPKFVDSYKTPELLYQGPAYGNQIEKLDRQSIKWLTPKYCYALDSVGKTITTGNSDTIDWDTFETNDQRMSATVWWITIPQAGLRLIKVLLRKISSYAWWVNIWLMVNWNTILDTNWWAYEEIDMKASWDSPITNFTVPLSLNQNDFIEVYITNSSWASCVYTAYFSTLRAVSYVLY